MSESKKRRVSPVAKKATVIYKDDTYNFNSKAEAVRFFKAKNINIYNSFGANYDKSKFKMKSLKHRDLFQFIGYSTDL